MKKYSFFSENQRKKILYCSLKGQEDKVFNSYQKSFEKDLLSLTPFSNLVDAKKFVSNNVPEIIGFILHFNWGESLCDEFISYLKEMNVLSKEVSFFMILDTKSSKERKKTFIWGARDALDSNNPDTVLLLRDHFLSYHGTLTSEIFLNLEIAFLDDSQKLIDSFQSFLQKRGLEKSWSFFKTIEDWNENEKEGSKKKGFDLIMIDYNFGETIAINLIEGMKKRNPKAKIFIISNYISSSVEQKCLDKGADFILVKPKDLNLILSKTLVAYSQFFLRES